MKGLNGKVSDLEKAAAQRKAKLDENSAFLQFNWKADVVESWIGECAERRPGRRRPFLLGQEERCRPGAPLLPKQLVSFCTEEPDLLRVYLGSPHQDAATSGGRERAPPRCSAPGPHKG